MHNLAAMIPDPSDESTRDRRPLRVFFSYAAEDDAYRIQLEKHLRMLQRDGLIETWHDRKILPGTAWGSAIDAQLEAADIVLLLVSADFLNSDYCVDIEMTRALERHDAQQAQVVPVIVRHCDWSTARFAKLQALPDRARPVEAWTSSDAAWTNVAKGIRALVAGEHRRPSVSVEPPSLTPYLRWVADENASVELRGMGANVAERMDLRQVYTRLIAAPAAGRERQTVEPDDHVAPERAQSHERELHELLAKHDHVVLVGDPGSGKTTFLRWVAQNLARAGLGDAEALERMPACSRGASACRRRGGSGVPGSRPR